MFKKWFSIGVLGVILCAMAVPANAAGTGSFNVGAWWQPPITPTDYNTGPNWANIAAANIDVVSVTDSTSPITKSVNESGIANSYANNVKLLVKDSSFYDFKSISDADYANLENIVLPYKNDPRVAGLFLRDEPEAWEVEGLANTYRHLKTFAPNLRFLVNQVPSNLGGWDGPAGKLAFSNAVATGNGATVATWNSVGQTIKIPAGMTFLDGVDMYIDMSTWSSSEILTLKLWNSPAKTTLIAQASKAGNGSTTRRYFYPYFSFRANVTPLSTYYIELTHNGGGNDSVGWVVRSNNNVYPDGAAYKNGISKPYDFFFRLYAARYHEGNVYENFLDDWLDQSGADTVMYDNYPFGPPGVDSVIFFDNMEQVRKRALYHDVKYEAFLQSIQINHLDGSISLRAPSYNEMRFSVYSYLTYGFKGLWWFTYWQPRNIDDQVYSNTPVTTTGGLTPRYTQVQTLSSEMRKLGATLKNLNSRRVYHAGSVPLGAKELPANFFVKPQDMSKPMIEGYFTDDAGRSYIMLTNRDYNNSYVFDFVFNPKPAALTEISKTTGLEGPVSGPASYNASTGILNLYLVQGEGRLFALPAGFSPYENLAALAKVSATSSYNSTADGWDVEQVNDDTKISTAASHGWSSKNLLSANHTESITFDLGSNKTVSEVDLYPRTDAALGVGFPIDFTIQTATDAGGPWTTVVAKTGYPLSSNTLQPFTFAPQTARYFKIEGTGLRQSSGEYRMQLAEVEIYSAANYAKQAAISATSSLETADWGIGKLKDGVKNSVSGAMGWTSNNSVTANHTESFTIDMLANKSISKVILYPRNDYAVMSQGFPVNFTIQTATNAAGPWTTVVSQAGYPNPPESAQTFSFPAQNARYVKVEGTSLRQVGTDYRMQITEVEIN